MSNRTDLQERIDAPYMEAAWQYIELKYDSLWGIVRRACGRKRHLTDDMFSDVMEKAVPRALRTYDPDKGHLDSHVRRAVKCYILKWWWRRRKWYALHRSFEDMSTLGTYTVDHFSRSEVTELLDKVSAYDRGVIVLKHLLEMTFDEMSDVLEVSKGTARNHYVVAMSRLREVACDAKSADQTLE